MRCIFYLIFFIFITSSLFAEKIENKNKIFNKKNFVILSLTIANPAMSVGTVVANTGTFQKMISFANITYSSIKGKSIAEEALSKTTNKDCLLKNLAEKKDFCL